MKYLRVTKENNLKIVEVEKKRLTNIYDIKVGNYFNDVEDIFPYFRIKIKSLYAGDFIIKDEVKDKFKPAIGQKYYYLENANTFAYRVNDGELIDILNIKIGNAFPALVNPSEEDALRICKIIDNDNQFIFV